MSWTETEDRDVSAILASRRLRRQRIHQKRKAIVVRIKATRRESASLKQTEAQRVEAARLAAAAAASAVKAAAKAERHARAEDDTRADYSRTELHLRGWSSVQIRLLGKRDCQRTDEPSGNVYGTWSGDRVRAMEATAAFREGRWGARS